MAADAGDEELMKAGRKTSINIHQSSAVCLTRI